MAYFWLWLIGISQKGRRNLLFFYPFFFSCSPSRFIRFFPFSSVSFRFLPFLSVFFPFFRFLLSISFSSSGKTGVDTVRETPCAKPREKRPQKQPLRSRAFWWEPTCPTVERGAWHAWRSLAAKRRGMLAFMSITAANLITVWLFCSWAGNFSRGIKRDKLNGTNRAKFAVFRWFWQIFAFPGNYSISEVQIFAENRRKPQIFAENRRKPQIFAETRLSLLVCPF